MDGFEVREVFRPSGRRGVMLVGTAVGEINIGDRLTFMGDDPVSFEVVTMEIGTLESIERGVLVIGVVPDPGDRLGAGAWLDRTTE